MPPGQHHTHGRSQYYQNQGYYGFEPDCFAPGGTVELAVWRGAESVVLPVSDELRLQIADHFRVFDSVTNKID